MDSSNSIAHAHDNSRRSQGFNGSQPGISDVYTNNGSLYLASFVFLPLGLPADHPFWTDDPLPWTSKKAWEGMDFKKDHAYRE